MSITLKNIGNEVDVDTREVKYFLVLEAPDGSVLRVPTTKEGTDEVVSFLYKGNEPEPSQESVSAPNPETISKPAEIEQGAEEFGGVAQEGVNDPLGAAADSSTTPPRKEVGEEANEDGRHPFVVDDVPSV